MNILRTGLLMAALTALFVFVGYLAGGEAGIAVAVLFATGTNLYAYRNADKVLLRMYGARPVDEAAAPDLVHLVRRLAAQAGLPMPKLFIVQNDQPNAFATGRDPAHAAVCVTNGLLARMTMEELAGVLAHELGHVKRRDTLAPTLAAIVAKALAKRAPDDGRRGWLRLVAMPLLTTLELMAGILFRMADSPEREFEADREGAAICGRPLWLAAALHKIGAVAASASHPSTEDRIARLCAMAQVVA